MAVAQASDFSVKEIIWASMEPDKDWWTPTTFTTSSGLYLFRGRTWSPSWMVKIAGKDCNE